MSQVNAYPEYEEIFAALNKKPDASITPAEAHGMICGVICATPNTSKPQWEKLVLGEMPNRDSVKILKQLYLSSISQISEFELEFTLLLPDDSGNINDRAEALGAWCQGFLIGLQQGLLKPAEDSEAAEALNDIAEIAQVSYGDIASAEEDESAYVELVEYVRLAVLMLYHDCRTNPPIGVIRNDNLLH